MDASTAGNVAPITPDAPVGELDSSDVGLDAEVNSMLAIESTAQTILATAGEEAAKAYLAAVRDKLRPTDPDWDPNVKKSSGGNVPDDPTITGSDFENLMSSVVPNFEDRKKLAENDPNMLPRVLREAQMSEQEKPSIELVNETEETQQAEIPTELPSTPPEPESPAESQEEVSTKINDKDIIVLPWANTPQVMMKFAEFYTNENTDPAFMYSKEYISDTAGNKMPSNSSIPMWAEGLNWRFILATQGDGGRVLGFATFCKHNKIHNTAELRFVVEHDLSPEVLEEIMDVLAHTGIEYLKLDQFTIQCIMMHSMIPISKAIKSRSRQVGRLSDVIDIKAKAEDGSPIRKSVLVFEINRYYYYNVLKAETPTEV